jgi:RNA polymerase sigma-70 factor (ECF subfamily)
LKDALEFFFGTAPDLTK